jgi:hypothetical protein
MFRMSRRAEAPRERRVPRWKIAVSVFSFLALTPVIGLVAGFLVIAFAPVIPLMAVLLVGFTVRGRAPDQTPSDLPDPSGSHEPSLENPHAFGQIG